MSKDALSSITTNLNSVAVRDKVLRFIQYAAKIEKFASPENQKILRAVSSNLGGSRRAFRLWRWLEGIDASRKLVSPDPATLALGYARHSLYSTYFFCDNLIWCGERGIWKPADFDRFKKFTYTVWYLAILANILLSIRSYQVVVETIISTEVARKKLVQKRRDGENVDKEMSDAMQKMRSLESKKFELAQALLRDGLDFFIPFNQAHNGTIVNENVIGLIGVFTSILSLFNIWK